MTDTEKQAHAFANMVVSKFLDHKDDSFVIADIKQTVNNQSIILDLYNVCFYAFLNNSKQDFHQDLKLLVSKIFLRGHDDH